MTTDNNLHTKLFFSDPCDARGFRTALAERVAELGDADEDELAAAVAGALASLSWGHEARLCGPEEVKGTTVTTAALARELFNALPAWARNAVWLRSLRGVADRALRRALLSEGFVEIPRRARRPFDGAPFAHTADVADLLADRERYAAHAALEGPVALRELADALEWASALVSGAGE